MKFFTQSIMRSVLALALFSFMILPAFAQNGPIDFEAGGFGADWTWTVFENDDNPAVEIIANPDPNGGNTSATVAKFTARQLGQPFAGCETMHGADIGTFNIGPTNSTISIMVWKSEISDVGIKLVAADGGALPEIKIPNTLVNQWEQITFDFSAQNTLTYDQIVIFPDFNARTQDNIIYFDNITFGEGVVIEEPMTAAPDPTHDPADVLSIFSDTYTNVADTDFNPDWGQSTVVTQIDIAGNNTLKYGNLNYQGTMFASPIDVSGMNSLHIDYWTANSTGFNGFLISSGPQETPHAFTVTTGQWVSVDIPLSTFSSVVDLADVIQMKFDGNGTIFLDNIYFHKGTTMVTEPMTAAPDPIHASTDVLSIFSDSYTNVADTDFNPDWGQATVVTQIDITGNNTLKYENLNYQGTQFASPVDVSGMDFLHVDYWTANSTGFNGFLISSGPVETAHAFAVTTGEWVSVDIPLSTFSSVVDLADVIQMKFDGDGTIYLDNIYFHNGTTMATEPMTAAPDPIHAPADVLSIFSDSYTNVADTDFNPDWGQATVTTQVDIAGNNTLLYENLNYQGTMLGSSIDVSGMDFLHVDYWTANSTGFNGFLISPGPLETPHAFAVTTGEWVSVDIPLSVFSSVVDLADVFQLKFDGNGTIYLDNIYFHKGTTSVSSFRENNVELFPNPVQSTFTISTDKNIEEIRIYDALGLLVLNKRVLNNTTNFNIAHLANGMYSVVAIIDGESMVGRLIKN